VIKAIKRVLVVDDEELVRKLLKDIINSFHPDIVVVPAEHGEQAWELISAPGKVFDLVISDVDMPNLNGVQLVERIRKDHPSVQIILMSGNLEPKEHKANAFLQKPFSLAQISTTIKRLMQKNKP